MIMAEASRGKGAVKFIFWGAVAVGLFYYAFHAYNTGQLVSWYYYKASADGFAVNADTLKGASKEKPALLTIGAFQTIEGLQAVPVKKGDRLPVNANGIITSAQLKKKERAVLEDNVIKVMVPVKIAESKGFKYKDSFKHKGIQTNPWAAAWNVGLVLFLGLSLGLLAEGFTDMCGLKLVKIDHMH
jgi:hypothetical protein